MGKDNNRGDSDCAGFSIFHLFCKRYIIKRGINNKKIDCLNNDPIEIIKIHLTILNFLSSKLWYISIKKITRIINA